MPELAQVMSLALVLLVVTAGSAIQVSIGMGLNLFAIPLLVMVDPAYAPGPVLAASMVLSVLAIWRIPVQVDPREMGYSMIGLAIGSLAAAFILATIDTAALIRLMGGLIVAAVALVLSGLSFAIRPSSLVMAGGAAGIMGTIAGVHAPPIALLYSGQAPMRVRGALLTFIMTGNVLSIGVLAAIGRFGWPEIRITGLLLPGVCLGVLIAPLLARLLDARRTRLAVLAISAASGLALLLRG